MSIEIKTERLRLRPFTMEDVDRYFPIIEEESVRKYVPYAGARTKEAATKLVSYYKNGDFNNDFYFIIEDVNSKKILGALIAIRIGSSSLDISYLIGSPYRNNGYMTEALRGFIQYIYSNFSPVRYHSLQITVNNDNISSKCVVKKCGGKPFRELSHSTIYRIHINHFDLL